MSWASSLDAALEGDHDGVDAATGLHVQVGVDHAVRRCLDADHLTHRDVLLEGDLHVVDLVGLLLQGLLAFGRHQVGQVVDTKATNWSDLATKSVSDRSWTMAATPVGVPDGHRSLGGVAIGPLGLAGQPLLPEPRSPPCRCHRPSPRGRSWRRACPRRSSGGASGRPWRRSRARQASSLVVGAGAARPGSPRPRGPGRPVLPVPGPVRPVRGRRRPVLWSRRPVLSSRRPVLSSRRPVLSVSAAGASAAAAGAAAPLPPARPPAAGAVSTAGAAGGGGIGAAGAGPRRAPGRPAGPGAAGRRTGPPRRRRRPRGTSGRRSGWRRRCPGIT